MGRELRVEEMERRTVKAREVRASDDPEAPVITGYAAVFSQLSDDLGGFREIIQPGFFDSVLADDVRSLWNHNRDLLLGRTKAGTLRLRQDDQGLAIEVDPPETSWARDALVTIRRGDVDQMSFAFDVREGGDSWEARPDGSLIRTLLAGGAARLYDVSPVTFPAYPTTSVAVRAQVRSLRGEGGAGQGAGPVGDGEEGGPRGRLDLMRRRLELEEIAG